MGKFSNLRWLNREFKKSYFFGWIYLGKGVENVLFSKKLGKMWKKTIKSWLNHRRFENWLITFPLIRYETVLVTQCRGTRMKFRTWTFSTKFSKMWHILCIFGLARLTSLWLCSYWNGKNEVLGIMPEMTFLEKEKSYRIFKKNLIKKY